MPDDTFAEITSGKLQGGKNKSGVRFWLGIPYAKAKRFTAPEPFPAWTGVREASAFGNVCPSAMGTSLKETSGEGISEECLHLNVWSPPQDDQLKPVLFWIHGGAFLGGSGNAFSGDDFASKGDIVVVSINYRLGVLGFVNFGEALGIDSIPSNLGLRDQIAALEWVQENIAAFGGDPKRVTIAGESAGSTSCSFMMLNAKTWHLFHGAILESGANTLSHSRERSLRFAEQYLQHLGLKNAALESLQELPLEEFFKAQVKVLEDNPSHVPAAPWYDNDLLPKDYPTSRTSPTASVPMLAGFNKDEFRFFELVPGPEILPMNRAEHDKLIKAQIDSPLSENIITAYKNTKSENRKLGTHFSFALPTFHFAERHSKNNPVWCYRFDAGNSIFGAVHALELLYLWPLKGFLFFLARGGFLRGWKHDLAKRMQAHWANFVRDGKPHSNWPSFNTNDRKTLVFNKQDNIIEDPEAPLREVWQGQDIHLGK
jgi:para-nitrobenzyl esterase